MLYACLIRQKVDIYMNSLPCPLPLYYLFTQINRSSSGRAMNLELKGGETHAFTQK